VLRILAAKARRGLLPGHAQLGPPDVSVLNSADHRELALDVARKSVTLQRDSAGLLPLRADQRILVVEAPSITRSDVVDDELASTLVDAIKQFAPSAVAASATGAVAAAASADVVVLGTFDLPQDAAQEVLAQQLVDTGKPVVAVSLRGPYDAAVSTEIGTFLAVYGDRPVHLQAAAEALFGRISPTGQVP
jgi:beta-N-acetylhexosaminidase